MYWTQLGTGQSIVIKEVPIATLGTTGKFPDYRGVLSLECPRDVL